MKILGHSKAESMLSDLQQRCFAELKLNQRWQNRAHFSILLSDFQNGELFLNIWLAWQQDLARCQRLHCIAFVPQPFTLPPSPIGTEAKDEVSEIASLYRELQQAWPQPIAGFHRIYLAGSKVMLTLVFGPISTLLHEVTGPIDTFILNQQLSDLDLPLLKQIWRLCKADSLILSTIDSELSQLNLSKSGFLAQTQQAHPVLSAHCLRAPKRASPPAVNKAAIIVGAGLAGCAAAASLAQRGWQVQLLDAQDTLASQASGNHVGLCHPTFSLDDNLQAKLSRAGFFTTQQKIIGLRDAKQDVHFAMAGHFQMAKDAAAAALMLAILREQQWPASLISYMSAAQAQQQLQIDSEFGGWWFPQGMWINPASVCNGYIHNCIENIVLSLNTHVEEIKNIDDCWHLFDRQGQDLGQTEILILANAHDAARLLPNAELALSSSLRSVTKIPAAHIKASQYGLSGLSYLTAEFAGFRCAGAGLVSPSASDSEVEAANLSDLKRLIGPAALSSDTGAQTRQCTRPNSADRLPLVGQIPDSAPILHSVHQLFHIPRVKGLYGVLGFGSRGLSWHALAAEVLACQLNQEPAPIERSLLDAIDPARFKLRRLRKLTSGQQIKK